MIHITAHIASNRMGRRILVILKSRQYRANRGNFEEPSEKE